MEDQVVDVKKRRKRQEYHKQYHLENSEKIQEHKKQYYLENNEKIKQYRLENKEKIKQYNLENSEKYRGSKLKSKYGLTLDDFNKMLQEQNGSCAICLIKAEDTKKKYLCVDHNHLTGKVRKLLCNSCNISLGLLKESQEIIANLSRYLYENGSCAPEEGR